MKRIAILTNSQYLKTLLALTFIMIILIAPALAQGDGFDDPAPGDVPIDGGLSLLVAAGVGYGMKKVKQKRKK